MGNLVLFGLLIFACLVIGYQMGVNDRPRCTVTQAAKDAVWDTVWGSSDSDKGKR